MAVAVGLCLRMCLAFHDFPQSPGQQEIQGLLPGFAWQL